MENIKLKYKNKYIEDIVPGTTLYQISKQVKSEYKYPIVVARLGEFLVGLNTPVTKDSNVEFFDLGTSIGNKVYARSLEFLVTVAAKKVLDKQSDVLINYSLENGIYCEVVGQRITKITAQNIENQMRIMVENQMPFYHMNVERFEAIKYFESHNQQDKVNNLKYMTNKTITLHSLDNVYDYFYGPLVYNTGIIQNFKMIYLKENSFIITYPTRHNPFEVEQYIHHKMTFDVYKEYQKWGRTVGLSTTNDLNELCTKHEYTDVIELFESHYEDQLASLAEQIYKRKDKVKLVLLAGPSSSGKTTTAKKLALYLRVKGLKPHKISLDDYFVNREDTPLDEDGKYDYASIGATDVKLFNKQLNQLLNGEQISMPRYNFILGKKEYRGDYLQLQEDDILIIEGIHTLNDALTSTIPRENKFKIFMSPLIHLKLDNHNRVHTTDLRKIRRIVRDSRTRGTTAEGTLMVWPNVDKEAKNNIYPYQDDADGMINSSLGYELSVLRIYAEPLLYGIPSNSPEYPEAMRLINLLKNFLPITSEVVPKDSILREFIGGGIFED